MRKRCYYDNRCNPREVVIIKVNFLIRTICQIMLWWSGQNAKKSFDTLCYHHPNKVLAKFQPQNPERIKQVGSRHRLHILMMFFMQSATTRKRFRFWVSTYFGSVCACAQTLALKAGLLKILVTIDNPGCLVVCISPQVQKTIRVHMTIVGNGVKKHKQKAHAEK